MKEAREEVEGWRKEERSDEGGGEGVGGEWESEGGRGWSVRGEGQRRDEGTGVRWNYS